MTTFSCYMHMLMGNLHMQKVQNYAADANMNTWNILDDDDGDYFQN